MHIKMSYKNSLMSAYIRLDLTCVGGFEMHKNYFVISPLLVTKQIYMKC